MLQFLFDGQCHTTPHSKHTVTTGIVNRALERELGVTEVTTARQQLLLLLWSSPHAMR